ncbi:MAG: hypothetical protein Unbinned200contig1000_43 [Prokaryotic dsDNA virus sp.]|nr:MAG: hypothetical protein Unbinned200contig1000_43 [Prokaryotic dsDNA virus sp.]
MKTYEHAVSSIEKIKFMREAGAVRRCHTIPIVGEYNLAIHKFNMLSMLRVLWPEASLFLVWAIIEHDIPERLTGDIPAPAKWLNLIDSESLSDLESDILIDTINYDHGSALNEIEKKWLHGLDILELALFCRDQIHIGNRNLEVMLDRIHKYIKKNGEKFHPKILDTYWESSNHDWSFMPDLGDVS